MEDRYGVCSICQSAHRIFLSPIPTPEMDAMYVMDQHHAAHVVDDDCEDMSHCEHDQCEGFGTEPQCLL